MSIQINPVNNKTFAYQLAFKYRENELLCRVILYLFVHNIDKTLDIVNDKTADPTVRVYYADLLLKRHLVRIDKYGSIDSNNKLNFDETLLEKIQQAAFVGTSSEDSIIQSWVNREHALYSKEKKNDMSKRRNPTEENTYKKFQTSRGLIKVLEKVKGFGYLSKKFAPNVYEDLSPEFQKALDNTLKSYQGNIY